MNYENFMELVKKRRTIRKFKPEELVTKDEVYKIIEAGRLAPSGMNTQLWEFVVVQEKQLREEMVRYMLAAMQGKKVEEVSVNMSEGFGSAPTFIVIYGDSRVQRYAPPHLRTDDKAWQFVVDVTLSAAVEQMHLAAASLDLGTMWVSAIRRPGVDEKVRDLLGIPNHLQLFELMAIGHPNQEPAPKRLRPLEEMVHWNQCGEEDFRTQEEMEHWFKRK